MFTTFEIVLITIVLTLVSIRLLRKMFKKLNSKKGEDI